MVVTRSDGLAVAGLGSEPRSWHGMAGWDGMGCARRVGVGHHGRACVRVGVVVKWRSWARGGGRDGRNVAWVAELRWRRGRLEVRLRGGSIGAAGGGGGVHGQGNGSVALLSILQQFKGRGGACRVAVVSQLVGSRGLLRIVLAGLVRGGSGSQGIGMAVGPGSRLGNGACRVEVAVGLRRLTVIRGVGSWYFSRQGLDPVTLTIRDWSGTNFLSLPPISSSWGSSYYTLLVAFTDEERLIGDSAKNEFRSNPTNTVFGAKRLIGPEDRRGSASATWPREYLRGRRRGLHVFEHIVPHLQRDIKHLPFKRPTNLLCVLWAIATRTCRMPAPPPAELRYSPMEALCAQREEDGIRFFEVLDVEKVFTLIIFSREDQYRGEARDCGVSTTQSRRTTTNVSCVPDSRGISVMMKETAEALPWQEGYARCYHRPCLCVSTCTSMTLHQATLGGGTFDVFLLSIEDGVSRSWQLSVIPILVYKKKTGTDVSTNLRALGKLNLRTSACNPARLLRTP
ncbi:hypothetical protein EDB84DRAFT_1640948 [Lactarius hengduanensis]|nr:hypothetical protein EDB84DRAFT_1640948 [Lactarius hengduanensis]